MRIHSNMEILEGRRLFSQTFAINLVGKAAASLEGSSIVVSGTDKDDVVTRVDSQVRGSAEAGSLVKADGGGIGMTELKVNGVTIYAVIGTKVENVAIVASEGNGGLLPGSLGGSELNGIAATKTGSNFVLDQLRSLKESYRSEWMKGENMDEGLFGEMLTQLQSLYSQLTIEL